MDNFSYQKRRMLENYIVFNTGLIRQTKQKYGNTNLFFLFQFINYNNNSHYINNETTQMQVWGLIDRSIDRYFFSIIWSDSSDKKGQL